MAMGGSGCVVALFVIFMLVTKSGFLGGGDGGQIQLPDLSQINVPQQGGGSGEIDDEMGDYVEAVLGSTEDVWTAIFRDYGMRYQPARVVHYSGTTRMPGGVAQSATGPFYLPADQTVYLDSQFFSQLRQMARDRTEDYDFAPAYVIAHEVAHHVQNLLGYTDKVHSQINRIPDAQYNQLSVRLELQADYLAGVWAHHANKQMMASDGVTLLEDGDVEEAMRAAKAIGDDELQRSSGGRIRPDSFTHGTSEQRLRWFTSGLKTGNVDQAARAFQLNYSDL